MLYPTPRLPFHTDFPPFRSICQKDNRSPALRGAPGHGVAAPAERCAEGSQVMS